MMSIRAILFALSFSIAATAPAWGAQAAKPEAKKPEAKAKRAPPGRTETLACRLGTEDRHARIAVVVIKGRTDSFAYYSKWKPRTCSIYLQRNRDPYSQWSDKGNVTNVNLERGLMMIEHKKGEYRFVFRDIDRERYCGMDGTINGTLTIRKGSERCELACIMEEGTPLGQAFANVEQTAPAVTVAGVALGSVVTRCPPRRSPAAPRGAAAPPPRSGSGGRHTLARTPPARAACRCDTPRPTATSGTRRRSRRSTARSRTSRV